MATRLYKRNFIKTVDGKTIEITPLKLRYMHDFMETFENIKNIKNDDKVIQELVECVRIAMEQYYPEISGSSEEVEDTFDLPTIYQVLDYAAGIKINDSKKETIKEQTTKNQEDKGWTDFDLLTLENEVFMIGIWKSFEDLERHLSLPELINIISAIRDLDYREKKFLAAMQGVDLDANSGAEKGQKEWEDMKARVFSKGQATDSKDILALQGANARKAGFGIGMVLGYEDLRSKPS
jgi:hypothetical protein